MVIAMASIILLVQFVHFFMALPLVQRSSEFHKLCAAIHHPEQDRREKKHA